MIKLGVWRDYKKKNVPDDRKCIKNKWVFDMKQNDIFRAWLVVCGYSQIPGVDFTESYALVINDVTWRILLIMKMILKLKARITDVKTVFLHGELDEEIFMESPEGLGHNKDEDCVKLEKAMYGLVQGARQYATLYRTPGPLNLCDHHNKERLPGSRIGTSVPSMQIKHRVCLSHSLKQLENTMMSSAKSVIASVKQFTQFLYVSRLLQPTILQCTALLLYTLRKTSVQRR